MPRFKKLIDPLLFLFCWACILRPPAQARACQPSQPNPSGRGIGIATKPLEDCKQSPAAAIARGWSLRLQRNFPEAILCYQQNLHSHPGSRSVLFELGEALRMARRFPESIQVFRKLVQSNPNNLDAQVGLGEALAATGQNDKALTSFNKVLRKRPTYYDALQGKAYVLFWQGKLETARSTFEALRKRDPHDRQNVQALNEIAQAEEATYWKTLRPAANASPQSWIAFYRKRLARFPKDRAALKGLAYEEMQMNRRNAAIQDYRQVLRIYPDDRDSELELARLLSFDHLYAPAIRLYRQVIQQDPQNANAMFDLARVHAWSGQPQKALRIDRQLLRRDPANTGYLLAAGQIEMRLKRYHAARQTFYALLEVDPANRIAQLNVARIDFDQNQYQAALQNYKILLRRNPRGSAALLGEARIDFCRGKLQAAEGRAAEVVREFPNNISALYLLASIEHARHQRRKALTLLARLERLDPGATEVASLRDQTLQEFMVTLTTTLAFAREIGPPTEYNGHGGLANEDLRTHTYWTTIGINFLPRTNSYISFTSVPTDSPPGPYQDSFGNQIPTGITGATAPYEILYRQSTRLSRRFTLRAGAGSARFGPGDLVSIPGEISLVEAAKRRPIGLVGFSYQLANKFRIDVDATQMAITYTPVSTRLGVIRDQLRGRINYFFNARTQLHFAYWYGYYSSENYLHTADVDGKIENSRRVDHDQAHGGSITFETNLLHTKRFSLDEDYEGLIYGFAGKGRNVYLGFFNPSFYQRHEIVPRVYGQLLGPLGFDLRAGFGIQQVGRGEAITRAWNISPNLSLRASRHLKLILGYVHYNTAQILGPLRGNEVRFSTEWRY